MTELLGLAAVVRHTDDAALKPMLATYVEDLIEYPADLLHDACRQWRRTQKFWPTIAELIEIMEPRIKHRRWMLDHARRHPSS